MDRSPHFPGRRLPVWVRLRALLTFASPSQVASSPSRCTAVSGRRLRSQPDGEPGFDRTLCNRNRPCCVGPVAIIRLLSCKPEQRTSDGRSLSIDESFLGMGLPNRPRRDHGSGARHDGPGSCQFGRALPTWLELAIVLNFVLRADPGDDCPTPKVRDSGLHYASRRRDGLAHRPGSSCDPPTRQSRRPSPLPSSRDDEVDALADQPEPECK